MGVSLSAPSGPRTCLLNSSHGPDPATLSILLPFLPDQPNTENFANSASLRAPIRAASCVPILLPVAMRLLWQFTTHIGKPFGVQRFPDQRKISIPHVWQIFSLLV